MMTYWRWRLTHFFTTAPPAPWPFRLSFYLKETAKWQRWRTFSHFCNRRSYMGIFSYIVIWLVLLLSTKNTLLLGVRVSLPFFFHFSARRSKQKTFLLPPQLKTGGFNDLTAWKGNLDENRRKCDNRDARRPYVCVRSFLVSRMNKISSALWWWPIGEIPGIRLWWDLLSFAISIIREWRECTSWCTSYLSVKFPFVLL